VLAAHSARDSRRQVITITFIARGETLNALRTKGLILESVDGDLHLTNVAATDDPATVGPVDVVLVCVKSTQIEAIAPTLRPLIGANTAVIPLQNGVEASAQLAKVLGDGHVLEGLRRLISEQVGPAHIKHSAVTPVAGIRSASKHTIRRAGADADRAARRGHQCGGHAGDHARAHGHRALGEIPVHRPVRHGGRRDAFAEWVQCVQFPRRGRS
jgi:ketopantoate reductase